MSTGGQYHNYGVKLGANGIDGTIDHTYKLENRINADGSNMVYLYVDDQEIGPMNHHWVGGTDKKETVDWLNGQDLVFTHMGTSPHTVGNCYIDYIQVWENGKPDERSLQDFRWEIENNAMVSVTTNGNTINDLTLNTGSITGGVLKNIRYSLSKAVNLYHDEPWVMEWRSSGNWDGMLLASNLDTAVNGTTYLFRFAPMKFLALGDHTNTWNNYGLVHEIDMSVPHLFRLENRIGADGTNTVYLLVDAIEIDAMHHYYNSGTNQNKIVNWANGRDLVFGNIGTSGHPVNNMQLEYLQIWEKGHDHDCRSAVTAPTCTEKGYTTYTCDCGSSYVSDYVDAVGHSYENSYCTDCGAEHPELADYSGKVISIMGDSISTFAGYIPVADGFNMEHLARYPQDNLLTDLNETWWMQVVAELDAKLGINDSWRGATLSGGAPVTTGTTGENAAMSNLTRIQNLGSNGTPDVILLYGGTNDLAHVSKVGRFDPANAPTEVDLTTKKWDNLADGFLHTILRMRHYYPDAVIVAMLPTYTASYYSDEKLAQGNAVMAAICEHYGIAYVDLRESGVTAGHLPDGIHPGKEGMDLITEAVVDALLSRCDVQAGENVVYPVSHGLEGVKASLGHWKGVSAGKAFVETLTGDDLSVTVTMDGADITEEVYENGVISIEEVTGALVITAKGVFTADGHLQLLPETAYNTTNLWDVLEHDEMYYAANGWAVHSSGKVKSVTVPVVAGDRIRATSFGAAGEKGANMNGIRVTYFTKEGLLKSMGADEVYKEFSKNGYLTVPEGAAAVCVPMWAEDGAEMYIMTLPAIPSDKNVHVMDYTQQIILDEKNVIHLDADGMGCFGEAGIRLEMACGTAVVEEDGVVYTPGTMQWNGYDRFYAFAKENETYSFINNTTGMILVQVSDVKGIYPSSYYIVDTGANTAEGYYQVPTISFVGMGYSTYQVTIMVTSAAASKNRFAFYLDGIRVYNPLGEDAKDETVVSYFDEESNAAAQGMVSISHTADLYYELMPIEGYVVIRNTSDAILAVTKVKLMVSGDPQRISAQVEKVSQAEVLEAVDEFDALPMMTYRLRNFRPDVEITQPEASPEELAMAQMRVLLEKLFGAIRNWLKNA